MKTNVYILIVLIYCSAIASAQTRIYEIIKVANDTMILEPPDLVLKEDKSIKVIGKIKIDEDLKQKFGSKQVLDAYFNGYSLVTEVQINYSYLYLRKKVSIMVDTLKSKDSRVETGYRGILPIGNTREQEIFLIKGNVYSSDWEIDYQNLFLGISFLIVLILVVVNIFLVSRLWE